MDVSDNVTEEVQAKSSNDFALLLEKITCVKTDEFNHATEVQTFRKLREETEPA